MYRLRILEYHCASMISLADSVLAGIGTCEHKGADGKCICKSIKVT